MLNRIMWPPQSLADLLEENASSDRILIKWELQTLKFDPSLTCFQIYGEVWKNQKYLF